MKILYLVIPFVVSFLFGILFLLFLSPFELFWLDAKFILTSTLYSRYDISDHIVIIFVDKKSEDRLGIPVEGKQWRRYDIEMISLLDEAGARIIAFDVELSGEGTEWDSQLAACSRDAGNVISCEIDEGATVPLLRHAFFGVGNAAVQLIGGKPRKIDAFPRMSRQKAFSFIVTEAYLHSFEERGGLSALSDVKKRIADLPEFWINYRYPAHFFPVLSYVDVLLSEEGRIADQMKTPLSLVKDKVVLIAKAFDKDKIPLPNNFARNVYGGFIHAYGIETLLQQSQLRRIPVWIELIILLAVIGIVLLILSFTGRVMNFFLVSFIIFLGFVVQLWIFQSNHYWLFYFPLLAGALVCTGVHRFIRRILFSIEFRKIKKEMKTLEQYNEVLLETGKIKDILTDTLVHDIKNAIAAIEGGLHYVTEKYKRDKQSLQVFHGASIACTDIINLSSNLLDVRNIEEGKLKLRKESCSFARVEEMIRRYVLYPLFDEKQITITVQPPTFPLEIYTDMYLFEQICHNLLNNALKYTQHSGVIRISFSKDDGETRLCFFNSGKPIPDEQKELIFEKYLTAGKKRSRYSKGLGLYFCRMAMEMHGGKIWVKTEPEGNSFYLAFPPEAKE
jgi:signal transduction histidine kinase